MPCTICNQSGHNAAGCNSSFIRTSLNNLRASFIDVTDRANNTNIIQNIGFRQFKILIKTFINSTTSGWSAGLFKRVNQQFTWLIRANNFPGGHVIPRRYIEAVVLHDRLCIDRDVMNPRTVTAFKKRYVSIFCFVARFLFENLEQHDFIDIIQPDVTENAQIQHDVTENAQIQHDVTENAQIQHDVTENAQIQPDVTENAQIQPDVTENAQIQPDAIENTQIQPDAIENTQSHTTRGRTPIQQFIHQSNHLIAAATQWPSYAAEVRSELNDLPNIIHIQPTVPPRRRRRDRDVMSGSNKKSIPFHMDNNNASYIHDDACAICMDSIDDKNIIALNCKHAYCSKCVGEFVNRCNGKCPSCRENIQKICFKPSIMPDNFNTLISILN